MKLWLVTAASAALMAPALACASTGVGEPPTAAVVESVHHNALVLDSHADVLIDSTPRRYFLPDGSSRVSADKLKAGGVDAVVLSLAVGPGPRDAAGIAAARSEIDAKLAAVQASIAASQGQLVLVRSAADIVKAEQEGKTAVLLSFQNARALGTDIGAINSLYDQGVRVFAFNHAGHNDWADSSRPSEGEPLAEHNGLSPVGRQAVPRLNDLGVLIDVSQLSKDALLQTLALSRVPVAATHSNARTVREHTRSLSNEELDAIKVNGGVIQVTPFNTYLVQLDEAAKARVREVRVKYGLSSEFNAGNDNYSTLRGDTQQAFLDELAQVQPRATVKDFVDHIDYIARRIGVEHVGIGTDFDHGSGIEGYNSAADSRAVTAELLARGYTPEQVTAIWGGNFLRVLRAAEAARRV